MEEVINEDRLFVEVREIFKYLDKEIYNKIPEKIKKAINEYRGEYEFVYDTTKELNDQNISQATKDLIVGLYYRYVADENGKNIIISNIEKYEKQLSEKEIKQEEQFSIENILKKRKEALQIQEDLNDQSNTQELIVKNDSIFKRIVNKILNFFKKG